MEIIGIETATYEKTLKEIENFLDTIDAYSGGYPFSISGDIRSVSS